jgi:hypothetical protein
MPDVFGLASCSSDSVESVDVVDELFEFEIRENLDLDHHQSNRISAERSRNIPSTHPSLQTWPETQKKHR